MLLSPASTSASLPAQSFWDTFRPKNKDDMRNKQAQRALARQRLLTLAYGDMETVRMLPNSYAELDAIARDWIKPPPEAVFSLRVPVEYASLHATRWVSGPNIYLTGEDSYQIALMGVQGLRVEIFSGPPPPPDSDEPPPPPPPPEMPATSSLELTPGEHVALDIINSDELDVIDHPTSTRAAVERFIQAQARAISIPSHRKSPKEWPQSAGKEDINFDALSSATPSPTEAVLDVAIVRRVLSAIRKVMEDLKADASQRLPANEAAAQLHTIYDLIFSSKRSCKALLNFQGDDAKIVLNSLQWLLDYPQSNSTQRSRLLSALLRLSRKSGLYPECIILKDIIREDDCAVASGHFGEVWKGKFRDQQVCLKVVKIYKQSHVDHLLKVFAKEAILWSRLSHRNLLPFYGIYHLTDSHGRVCLVSPWMNNGNIKEYLLENPQVDRVLLVSDVAAGVLYLHQKAKIVHGDLKGVNILVTESGKACLADFGLSNHVDAEMLTWTSESSANIGGTVRWQAPELFDTENENSKPTKETDVYAFSCVCYEIFTCQVPFHEISRESIVMMKVMGGKRPSRPAKDSVPFIEWGLTDSMWRLMERCWDRDSENRPTMESISRKAFLSSLVDDRPSGRGEALSPPQFRGAMHGFL